MTPDAAVSLERLLLPELVERCYHVLVPLDFRAVYSHLKHI